MSEKRKFPNPIRKRSSLKKEDAALPDEAQSAQQEKQAKNEEEEEINLKDETGQCTNLEIQMISERISKVQFRPLARFLCFTKRNLENFEAKHSATEQSSVDLIYEMLTEWKEKNGRKATRDILIEALKNIERNDIVNEIYSGQFTDKELLRISVMIPKEQQKFFSQLLGIPKDKMQDIERTCHENRYGDIEIIYQVLRQWKKANKIKATKEALIKAIKCLGRDDVINDIFKECRNPSHSGRTLQENMQEIQKRHFTSIQLPRSLWLKKRILPMEKLFLELTMMIKNDLGNSEHKTIDLKEIFHSHENITPRRILVEGHSGYGKTTLVLRLLSDWAREQHYIRDKFDLVFVIPLRHYKNSLSYHFLRQCDGVNGTEEERLKAIESIQDRVLLLLDGFDEASQKVKQDILPVLLSEKYPTMTIVVTCRTGYYHLNSKTTESIKFKVKKIDQSIWEDQSIWDKRIQIKGISEERRQEFLQKYLSVDAERVDEKLSEFNVSLNDFYECPLFLLLLAVLIHEKNIQTIGIKTELYRTIFNFVINRNLDREQILKEEIDAFSVENTFNSRNLLLNFSKLCLSKIKSETLSFDENETLKCANQRDDTDKIILFGFLSKEILFHNYEKKEYYELMHRSFSHFFAAFYLSELPDSELQEEIEELASMGVVPTEEQLLYPFLAGFLQSNAFVLLNALSRYNSFTSTFKSKYPCHLEDILLELPKTDNILNSLVSLMPFNWQDVEFNSSLNEWYVAVLEYLQQQGLDDKITLYIPENLEIINCLPGKFTINRIILNVEAAQNQAIHFESEKIQCRNLFVRSISTCLGFPMILKEMMMKIKADKVWLKVEYEHLSLETINKEKGNFFNLYTELMEGNLPSNNLYYLSLHKAEMTYFKKFSHQILDLLKLKKISYGLSLTISSAFKRSNAVIEELNSFIDAGSKSHLKSFGFAHFFNCIPLMFNFSNNGNPRKFLGLRGRFSIKSPDKIECFPVEHFYCIHLCFKERTDLLNLLTKCTNIRRLTSYPELISDLMMSDSIQNWEGFETIERLDLKINETTLYDKCLFLSGLFLFKNIQEVYIILSFINHQYSDFLFKLVSLLPSMNKFSLYFDVNRYHKFLMEFLDKLINSKNEENKNISVGELQVEGLWANTYSSLDFIDCLERCFQNNLIAKFSTMDSEICEIDEFVSHFIYNDQYRVKTEWNEEFSVYGMFSTGFDEFPELNLKISVVYL